VANIARTICLKTQKYTLVVYFCWNFFIHDTSHAAHKLVLATCSWNKHANIIFILDMNRKQADNSAACTHINFIEYTANKRSPC